MNTQVTLTLNEDIYRRAEFLAQLTDRDVPDVLADTLEQSLSPLSTSSNLSKPINALSDKEILALTEMQMDTVQDRYLSVLLDKQQAGELTSSEQVELWVLMEYYQGGLLKKASALREAVRRGLIEPLQP